MTTDNPAATTRKGYGWQHQKRRAALAPTVALGHTICWRCGRRIKAGQPWDLGHHDRDRSLYCGPEHRRCNRGAPWRRRDALRRANPPQRAPALTTLFGQ